MIVQIEPWIDEAELEQLRRVVASTFVVEHDLTGEFEGLVRTLTGSRFAVAMTNGTAALYCCLKALDIGPGDEVIVPDLTFVATANAVIQVGASPVFCDVESGTMGLSAAEMERTITARTKAVIPVHLYGQCADMDAILEVARHRNIRVVEDAAQGVGVRFRGRHAGTFGDLGVLSFYGNKTITCGEGGIVLTDNEKYRDRCYRLKNHGRIRKGVFVHEEIGYNFSFTEMQAAVGVAQMGKLERIIARKDEIRKRYEAGLGDLENLRPVKIDSRTTPVHWFTTYLTSERESLARFLSERGVQTRALFCPLHLQPCYTSSGIGGSGSFPVSTDLYERGISLPSSYGLTLDDQSFVIQEIRSFFRAG